MLVPSGRVLGPFAQVLLSLGRVLEPFFTVLGHFGTVLGPFAQVLIPSGRVLGPFAQVLLSLGRVFHPTIIRPSNHHKTIYPSNHTSFINFPCVYEAIIRLTNLLSISLIDPALLYSSNRPFKCSYFQPSIHPIKFCSNQPLIKPSFIQPSIRW